MQTLSFSEARNRLKSVLDKTVEDADIAIITRRNAQDAVVMSLGYYNSLIETVYLLQSPANAAHLAESVGQLRDGKVVERRLVDA
ncbi:MAG: type II toxin-antitoxin system prevent-host-death family antitoxin [Gammaproteobacteria bacterium]|nr:type II toxin-antitoxin system prevent-host-death family antitoxin [Gammaproteobacteria bacterium]